MIVTLTANPSIDRTVTLGDGSNAAPSFALSPPITIRVARVSTWRAP